MSPDPQPSERRIEPTEADFEAIRSTVMETARGRWFLAEYGREEAEPRPRRIAPFC